MNVTRSRTLVAHLLLLAVVLVWGATFSLVKSALTATTPLMFNLVRMALAFAVLADSSRNSAICRSPSTRRVSSLLAQMIPPTLPSSSGTGLYENV